MPAGGVRLSSTTSRAVSVVTSTFSADSSELRAKPNRLAALSTSAAIRFSNSSRLARLAPVISSVILVISSVASAATSSRPAWLIIT